jgi:clan AA aspartic protease
MAGAKMVMTTASEQGKPMGFVYADITLRNMISNKSVNVRAMVDTGTTHLLVPRAIAIELGFDPTEVSTTPVTLADGRQVFCPQIAPIEIAMDDRSCAVNVGVLGDESLMGVVPLELMGLAVDPCRQCLVPNPQHPDGPVFRTGKALFG